MARIATVGCLLLIALLFWTDVKKREDRPISWLPLMWMFLAGSRWVSSWLNLSAPLSSIDDYAEGSPVDRAAFLALIVWGLIVLYRRNIAWGRLLRENKWIVLYFLYCLSSVIWTDEPFILLKRWIKDLGNPIVALVMLTEQRPYEAVGITLRRLAFLLLPLSVLFLRYYPDLGRAYHGDGTPMFTGVGHQKNDLGLMCLTAGMYLFWKLLQKRTGSESAEKSDGFDLLLIAMLVWLLRMSDSQTSFACLATAVTVLVLSRATFISKKPSRIIGVLAVVAVSLLALQATFDVKTIVLGLLGRDPTLTGRAELWEVVSTLQVNPLVGAGFMSFWSGQRMAAIWRALGPGINQAHSGYLEQYLNLGYVGVAFIGVIMMSAANDIRKRLSVDSSACLLRLCLLSVAALYNYTEASFYGINNMWVLLLVASIHDATGVRQQGAIAQQVVNAEAISRFRPRAQTAQISRGWPHGRLPERSPQRHH